MDRKIIVPLATRVQEIQGVLWPDNTGHRILTTVLEDRDDHMANGQMLSYALTGHGEQGEYIAIPAAYAKWLQQCGVGGHEIEIARSTSPSTLDQCLAVAAIVMHHLRDVGGFPRIHIVMYCESWRKPRAKQIMEDVLIMFGHELNRIEFEVRSIPTDVSLRQRWNEILMRFNYWWTRQDIRRQIAETWHAAVTQKPLICNF